MARSPAKKKIKLTKTQELNLLNSVFDILMKPGDAADLLPAATEQIRSATKISHVSFSISGRGERSPFPPAAELSIAGILTIASSEPVDFDRSLTACLERIASFAGWRFSGSKSEEAPESKDAIDPLTSLPMASLFRFIFQQAMARARRNKTMLALLNIGIEDPQRGPEAFRAALFETAERLKRHCREGDSLARFEPNQFLWCISGLHRLEDLALLCEKVVQTMTRSVPWSNEELILNPAIGIGVFPYDGGETDQLIKQSETALQRARQMGGNTYQFYTEMLNTRMLEQLNFRRMLREAARNDEFVLHYQPVVNMASRVVEGVEALVRWRTPDGRIVMPGEFLATSESVGLIDQIDAWVATRACRQVQHWHAAGGKPLMVSVNISSYMFSKSDLHWRISAVLRETSMPPEQLELDIPQSLLIKDPEYSQQVLQRLRAVGVRLCMDDFGSGYLDLSHLKMFPVDTLKIDVESVRALTSDAAGRDILAAVISLAHSLNMRVIAEGVETEAEIEILKSRGCDAFQGRHFSLPVDADRLPDLLRVVRTEPPRPISTGIEPPPTESIRKSIEPEPEQPPAVESVPAPVVSTPHRSAGGIYLVACFHCGNIFNAVESNWCLCLVTERSVECPHCNACFCNAPVSYKIDFWKEATHPMWERRMEEEQLADDLPENPSPEAAKRPLVLVVDDERPVLGSAARALAELGCGVLVSGNGKQGLELARAYRPDLVLSDALMPKLDGWELCRLIKQERTSPRVVVMTTQNLQEKEKQALMTDSQADHLLQKPLSLNVLRSLIAKKA